MPYIIYHNNCFDGFCAAWVAKKRFPDAVLLPGTYGDPIPDTPLGSDVYMIDISWPRALMAAYAVGRNLRVLDHHKTAQAALADFPNCVFDMERSGAMLAWNEFFPNEKPPQIVEYVQDRDLWNWDLARSREISAWLESYPRELSIWDDLAFMLDHTKKDAIWDGAAILRLSEQKINEAVEQAQWIRIGGYEVPVVNTAQFFSEVGNALCLKHPEAPFAAYYFDRQDGQRQWGLRSANGFDVSAIAKLYGGGGHPAAAGFQTECPSAQQVLDLQQDWSVQVR
jgi:oligoribonuclease NrnB/cAMP/cGMP phosphodiesterase (DHH superfamily)